MPKRRKPSASVRRSRRRRKLRILVTVMLLLAMVPLLLILLIRFVDPPGSMVMAGRWIGGVTIRHRWVPLERMPKILIRTVVTSEDARFCDHWGVDWGAVEEAIEEAGARGDGEPRGASTITMQTAKNLFLWQRRSYLRKAIELPLAYAMSAIWPKRRVIEVYLNIAEWGPGVFGVEAAARYHFKRSASKITARQAAQLAAALPNPHVRNAGRPGPRTLRLARHIEKRVAREQVRIDCIYPKAAR